MHVKVHLGGRYINETSYYSGAAYVHTGQLFFNDTLSDLVGQQSPYNTHSGNRMQNTADNIYASTHGYTLMNVQYVNSGSGMSSGLTTTVTLSVTSTETSNNGSTSTASSVGTSQKPSNGGGGRVGGRPFWLW